jgi:hypothetical protein
VTMFFRKLQSNLMSANEYSGLELQKWYNHIQRIVDSEKSNPNLWTSLSLFDDTIIPALENVIQKQENLLKSKEKEFLDLKAVLAQEKNAASLLIKSLQEKDISNKAELKVLERSNEEQKKINIELGEKLSHQMRITNELDFKLSLSGKNTEQLVKNNEQIKQNNEQLETKLAAQTEASKIKIKEFEDQIALHVKTSDEFKDAMSLSNINHQESLSALSKAESKIEDLQKEMLNIQQQHYDATRLLLSTPPAPPQPLDKQLDKAKKLSQELLFQLVDKNQNIQGLSLIRWCDDPRLKQKKLQSELLTRGVILTVGALHQKVEMTKQYDRKEKIDCLSRAVDQLRNDYKKKILPKEATLSLKNLVKENVIKNILKEEKSTSEEDKSILHEKYLAEIDVAKMNLIDAYFKSPGIANLSLDACFTSAVEKVKKNNRYHAKLLNQPDILDKIRSGNYDATFAHVIGFIKSSMNINDIETSQDICSYAENALLEDFSNESGEVKEYGEINKSREINELRDIVNSEIEKLFEKMKRHLAHCSFQLSPRLSSNENSVFSSTRFSGSTRQDPISSISLQSKTLRRSMSA